MNASVRLPNGSEIVLVEISPSLWHLPSGAPGDAVATPTLCGLAGGVYAYGPWANDQRHCCGVCRARAPQGTFVTVQPPRKPRRPAKRRLPQLTPAQVKVLYRTYTEAPIGVPSLARLAWSRLGFPNEASCGNAIYRAFLDAGLAMRPRAESHRRTPAARRLRGHGRGTRGQVLDARTVDRLWRLYEAGWSTPQISARFHHRFGYPDAIAFRNVVEYAWKACGRRLRTNREAELLSRSRMPRKCTAHTSGADGRRPRPCTQRALAGSDFCLHHDPAHREAVQRRAEALRARKVLKPRVPWTRVRPHLEPLLVTRPDRFGRRLETAAGALARNTGIDPAVCSRYLNGRHETITVEYANRFLAPLGLTVADLERHLEEMAA